MILLKLKTAIIKSIIAVYCSEDGTSIIFSIFFLNSSNNTLKCPINSNLQISLIQIDKFKNNKIKQIVGIISGFY